MNTTSEICKKLQNKLKPKEAILICDSALIKKITNLDSSSIFLLITKDDLTILTDTRYRHLKLQWEHGFIIIKDFYENLKKLIEKTNTLYLNLNSVKYNFAYKISKFINIKNLPDIIEEVFQEKNQNEINDLKHAIKITEKSLEKGLKLITPEITEKQLQRALIINAYENKCDGLSFEPIVAFGENTGNIHHMASDKKLANSKIILIDLGFKYNNQCADMTRTFILDQHQTQLIETYKAVLKAKYESQKLYKNDCPIKDSAILANKILHSFKLPEIPHSLGHGVGYEVHELPLIHTKSKSAFKANTAVTIEPGVYFENQFGIRIEDIINIRENDNINLNSFTLDYKLKI